MLWAVRQLFAPLRYLKISQGERLLKSKRTYDWVLPVIAAAISAAVLCTWSIPLGLLSGTGLVAGVINLLNLLIAFFIAALAAVATFERPGLDDPMKGEPATLYRRSVSGGKELYILSHRQFICYLFGYLAFSSLLLLIGLHLVRLVMPSILVANPIKPEILPYLEIVSSFLFFFIFWQIVVAMLLGIYFLCDRLQFLSDPRV